MTSRYPSENEQGQPYCQQSWCTILNHSGEPPRLAEFWLLSTDGRTWERCCAHCMSMWEGITAAGSLTAEPMYEPEPAAVAAAPAAAASAPKGLWATYRAWKAQNRTAADLAETAVGFAAWGAVHEGRKRFEAHEAALTVQRQGNRTRQAAMRQNLADMNQRLQDENQR